MYTRQQSWKIWYREEKPELIKGEIDISVDMLDIIILLFSENDIKNIKLADMKKSVPPSTNRIYL
jgi:hypothetical protein